MAAFCARVSVVIFFLSLDICAGKEFAVEIKHKERPDVLCLKDNPTVSVTEGSDITLTCKCNNCDEIVWLKDCVKLVVTLDSSHSNCQVTYEPIVDTLSRNRTHNCRNNFNYVEYSSTFHGMTDNFGDRWICHNVNRTYSDFIIFAINFAVEIKHKTRPDVLGLPDNPTFNVTEGADITLTCKCNNCDEIVWFKDYVKLVATLDSSHSNCHVTYEPIVDTLSRNTTHSCRNNFNYVEYSSTFHGITDNFGDRWICRNKKNRTYSEFIIFAVVKEKIPSCEVSSSTDTSQVTLGERMNLLTSLNQSHCTEDYTLELRTGNVTHEFTSRLSNIINTSVSAFNVSESHIGSVSARFFCENPPLALTCSGVNRLTRRGPPFCSISSPTVPLILVDGVSLNDDITLTVYVEKYPCSGVSQFNLNIGDVQFHLANDTDEAVKKSITLTVAEVHLGDVNIGYTCNSVNSTVSCEGVNQLIQKRNSFIFIIIGVIGGTAASTGIIAFIVMWRKRFAKDKKNSKETRARTTASTDQPMSTGQPSGHYSALHSDPQHCRDLYKVIENEGETSTPIYVNVVSQEPDYVTPV